MKAAPTGDYHQAPFAPPAIEDVVAEIKSRGPDVVSAHHIETSSCIMLPIGYFKEVAAAVHEVGGLFVLDRIASGVIWVDISATGVDILISAPQ